MTPWSHPLSAKEWQKLFRKTFVFTGGEIVGSFLMSTGYLRGAHVPSCPVYAKAAKKRPAWLREKTSLSRPRASPRRATTLGSGRRGRADVEGP